MPVVCCRARYLPVFRLVRTITESNHQLRHVCPSAHTEQTTGWIFVKFEMFLFENLSRKYKIDLKLTRISKQSSSVLQELTGSQLVKKFPALYETRKFIYKFPPLVPARSQMHPFHGSPSPFLKIHLKLLEPELFFFNFSTPCIKM